MHAYLSTYLSHPIISGVNLTPVPVTRVATVSVFALLLLHTHMSVQARVPLSIGEALNSAVSVLSDDKY